MFQQPKTITYVAPATPIDIDQRYLVKVYTLTDLGVSKYPQPGDDPDNPTHRIQWDFLLADINGNKILNVEGNPYHHFDYTSSKTGKPKKTGGTTATARLWMEALFGRDIDESEIKTIASQLPGKTAVALFREKEKQNREGETYTQLAILKLSPRKAGAVVQAAEEVRAAQENARATVARAAVAEKPADDPFDDLPF
jgi:hypothetical protein